MNLAYDIESSKPDIQALLLHAYRGLVHSRYIALRFDSRSSMQDFMQRIEGDLSYGDGDDAVDEMLCMGISPQGLCRLGLNEVANGRGELESALDTFPFEFTDDLDSPRARRIIGQDACQWQWGDGQRKADIFLVQLTDSSNHKSRDALTALIDEFDALLIDVGHSDHDEKGPLNFRDGISNPVLSEGSAARWSQQAVAPGEFLLGHANSVGQLALSPSVPLDATGADQLPLLHDDFGLRRDLGRNGSYLVVQQFQADVDAFARFDDAIAEKMVGRDKCGKPLTPPSPSQPAPDINAFTYQPRDRHGLHCPLGAHIRRVNPRDSLEPDPAASLRQLSQHRILRRGRRYEDGDERGLMFLCFNAQLNRQFEFIQQNWIQNTRFHGLRDESDPLLGTTRQFTMPGLPVGERVILPKERPVAMLGGGYFFFPGKAALHYLAHLNTRQMPVT